MHNGLHISEIFAYKFMFNLTAVSGAVSTIVWAVDSGSHKMNFSVVSSVQLLSCVRLFVTSWTAARQAPCSSPTAKACSNSCPSSRWCHPTISSSLVPCFSISPSNDYSGLISFMIDWFDLLAVQGTLKSLLQHCSSNASILQHSAFFWSNSLSMGFPRQEYWNGLLFPPPGDYLDPGIEPVSPALAGRFFTTGATWEAPNHCTC